MTSSPPTLLVINGALRGASGNTGRLLARACAALPATPVRTLVLADYVGQVSDLVAAVRGADALLCASGVYWNAYGSPLQRFVEVMTAYEAAPWLLGKPAGVLLTMDSVGGTDSAARLLGALNLLGCSVPPLASVVLSRLACTAGNGIDLDDVWQPADIGVLIGNLLAAAAARQTAVYTAWPRRQLAAAIGPYPATGGLHIDAPPWA